MLLSLSSINLVWCKLGKVTIALVLYWPLSVMHASQKTVVFPLTGWQL